jgi:LysM repeat protein
MIRRQFLLGLALALLVPALSADEVALKPNHPDRYVVQKGDTLWDISARFLKDPWKWASVWTINEQVKNPHLIYPGDVIVLKYDAQGRPQLTAMRPEKLAPAPAQAAPAPAVAGAEAPPQAIEASPVAGEVPVPQAEAAPAAEPEVVERRVKPGVVRLSPKVHTQELRQPVPTIRPDAIAPFLTYPLVISPNDLEKAAYVAVGMDNRVALGNGSEFYARNMKKGENAEFYHVFRKGPELRHPETNELLAYEAMYLGEARKLADGDPSKLVVTRVKQEIIPTDRLLAAPKQASLPYYYPRPPQKAVRGYILRAINGLQEFGPRTVVSISLGARDGMEQGHVLRIMRHVGRAKDPVTGREFAMPDEDSGLLMVFRVFDKVSYALIMDANRPIHTGDSLRTP